MGLFYSKSQVRKGKRRLCDELYRQPCCRKWCSPSCIFSSEISSSAPRLESKAGLLLGFCA